MRCTSHSWCIFHVDTARLVRTDGQTDRREGGHSSSNGSPNERQKMLAVKGACVKEGNFPSPARSAHHIIPSLQVGVAYALSLLVVVVVVMMMDSFNHCFLAGVAPNRATHRPLTSPPDVDIGIGNAIQKWPLCSSGFVYSPQKRFKHDQISNPHARRHGACHVERFAS